MLEIVALCSCAFIVCIWCTAALGSSRTKNCLRQVLFLSNFEECNHSYLKSGSPNASNIKRTYKFFSPNKKQSMKFKFSKHKNSSNKFSTSPSSHKVHSPCLCEKKLNNVKEELQKKCVIMYENLMKKGYPCCERTSFHQHLEFNEDNSTRNNLQKDQFQKQNLQENYFQPENISGQEKLPVFNNQTQFAICKCVKEPNDVSMKKKSIQSSMNKLISRINSKTSPPFSRTTQTPPPFLSYKLICKACSQEKHRCLCFKISCK